VSELKRALFRLAFGLAVAAPACAAAAFVGTFTPGRTPYTGPQRVKIVDTQLAPLHCLTAAGCAWQSQDGCVIVAPVSAGPGQIYALLALATPDALLGHELRHCRDGHFHPPLLPMLERAP